MNFDLARKLFASANLLLLPDHKKANYLTGQRSLAKTRDHRWLSAEISLLGLNPKPAKARAPGTVGTVLKVGAGFDRTQYADLRLAWVKILPMRHGNQANPVANLRA
jgi:hypothetical protein